MKPCTYEREAAVRRSSSVSATAAAQTSILYRPASTHIDHLKDRIAEIHFLPTDVRSMSFNEDGKSGGRWTAEEHENFLIGLSKYGREWKKIQSLISTRTPAQIRSHAQKHFLKMNKEEERNASSSINSHKRKQDMINVLSAFESTINFLKIKREKISGGNSSPMTLSDDSSQREDELVAAEVLMKMSFECH